MTANQARYPIQLMARTLGVSRSGFYAHRDRRPCERAVADADLTPSIRPVSGRSIEPPGRAAVPRASMPNWPMKACGSVASGSSV